MSLVDKSDRSGMIHVYDDDGNLVRAVDREELFEHIRTILDTYSLDDAHRNAGFLLTDLGAE